VYIEAADVFEDLDLFFATSDNNIPPNPVAGGELSDSIRVSAKHTKKIRLRVVMFVEPGANLDQPPQPTGGTRYNRNQVTNVVQQLVAFGLGNHAGRGIRFDWDKNVPDAIERLESDCLKIQTPPSLGSVCALGQGILDNNPRNLNTEWFTDNVVGHAAGGPAALLTADSYDSDPCVANIYFVGQLWPGGGPDPFTYYGWTAPGPTTHWFIINDLLESNYSGLSSTDQQTKRKVAPHEAVCHLLTHRREHSVCDPDCRNNDLCQAGLTCFEAVHIPGHCSPTLGYPYRVHKSTKDEIANHVQGCGE